MAGLESVQFRTFLIFHTFHLSAYIFPQIDVVRGEKNIGKCMEN